MKYIELEENQLFCHEIMMISIFMSPTGERCDINCCIFMNSGGLFLVCPQKKDEVCDDILSPSV